MKPVYIFRHSPTEGAGHFATFLDRHGISQRLIAVDAGDSVPADTGGCAGLAFMGGPMSVNDPLPWIAAELALIRDAVARNVPVIGHCLGGQLMSKALGGQVSRNPVKEIGWGQVSVADNAAARDWLPGLQNFLSFHWHGETFSLPPGVSPILSSPYCANQAWVLGPHLAMQCHVEMTADMISSWCATGAGEIERHAGEPAVQQPGAMQQDLAPRLAQLHDAAERLYSRWIAGLARA
ncbi:MAG: type 1 glutamine amidotransferase [Rhodocyclaceae bacterium]|nr:type 1 glutamine amidotransferase [Rhodocyclaceae bacterium]